MAPSSQTLEPPQFPGRFRESSRLLSGAELLKAEDLAYETAKFASLQVQAGAPYLYSLCAVRLWTLIEAMVDEIALEAMRAPDRCPDQSILNKLKGPLVSFLRSSKDEQAELLTETLKQAVDAPLKLGVGRFEAILEPVGFGGSVNDEVRKALFELSQIRNVIVHKSGVADRRFEESCSWLGFSRGSQVSVSRNMFSRYLMAAYWYLTELFGRLEERIDGSRSDAVQDGLNAFLSCVTGQEASNATPSVSS